MVDFQTTTDINFVILIKSNYPQSLIFLFLTLLDPF